MDDSHATMTGRTVAEWERELGQQVRELRLRQNRSQADVAREANVSVATLQGLEYGQGSNLKTLVQVVRALGRDDWLDQLAPRITVSPMRLLRERQARESRARRRASGSRAGRQRAHTQPEKG